jgi:hypothetical protein
MGGNSDGVVTVLHHREAAQRLIVTVFPVSRLVAVPTNGPAPKSLPLLNMKELRTSDAVGWMRTAKLHVSPAPSVSGPCGCRSRFGFVAPAVPAKTSAPSEKAAMTPARRFHLDPPVLLNEYR